MLSDAPVEDQSLQGKFQHYNGYSITKTALETQESGNQVIMAHRRYLMVQGGPVNSTLQCTGKQQITSLRGYDNERLVLRVSQTTGFI